jgi:hypothetical protein
LLQARGENRVNLADSTVSLDVIMPALDDSRSETLVLLRSLEQVLLQKTPCPAIRATSVPATAGDCRGGVLYPCFRC